MKVRGEIKDPVQHANQTSTLMLELYPISLKHMTCTRSSVDNKQLLINTLLIYTVHFETGNQ